MPKKKTKANASVKSVVRRRIVESGPDRFENHRRDFETCPSCGFNQDWNKWAKTSTVLVLKPYSFRAGCVAVMAECPKCFSGSWTHETFGCFQAGREWPKNWSVAVEKLEASVQLAALRDWGSAICHRCRHLESGTVNFHAWRHCIIGSGPAEISCEKFEPI